MCHFGNAMCSMRHNQTEPHKPFQFMCKLFEQTRQWFLMLATMQVAQIQIKFYLNCSWECCVSKHLKYSGNCEQCKQNLKSAWEDPTENSLNKRRGTSSLFRACQEMNMSKLANIMFTQNWAKLASVCSLCLAVTTHRTGIDACWFTRFEPHHHLLFQCKLWTNCNIEHLRACWKNDCSPLWSQMTTVVATSIHWPKWASAHGPRTSKNLPFLTSNTWFHAALAMPLSSSQCSPTNSICQQQNVASGAHTEFPMLCKMAHWSCQ